jgi:hypothetical protein
MPHNSTKRVSGGNARRTTKIPTTTAITLAPTHVRPDVAAQYCGLSAFRIEELMRSGLLGYKIVPGSDSRVIPLKVLDKFMDSLPLQSGALAGRGCNAA